MYYRYPLYRYPYQMKSSPKYSPKVSYPSNQNMNQPHNTSLQKEFSNNEKENRLQNSKTDTTRTSESALFEVFGIKLYFDDILLICLIFFLYNEGVQDQYLFISLILLLLS